MSNDEMQYRDRSEAPPPPMNIDENLKDVEMKQCAEMDKSQCLNYYHLLYQLFRRIPTKAVQPPPAPPLPDNKDLILSSDIVDSDSDYACIKNSESEIEAMESHLRFVESGLENELKSKLNNDEYKYYGNEINHCRKILREAIKCTHDGTKFQGDGRIQLVSARKKYIEFQGLYRKLLEKVDKRMISKIRNQQKTCRSFS